MAPRVERFIERAMGPGGPKDGVGITIDSAEWYIEAALNYSLAEVWTPCSENWMDSILWEIPASDNVLLQADASAAFVEVAEAIAPMIQVGENHLILADVELFNEIEGQVNAIVYLHFGGGYNKTVNASYGPNDYRSAGGGIPNCGCGPAQGNLGLCADKQIQARIQQTITLPQSPCFFTNVQQINPSPTGFPTGLPATPYKIYYCSPGPSCPQCFSPAWLSHYTQGTWDVAHFYAQLLGKQLAAATVDWNTVLNWPNNF